MCVSTASSRAPSHARASPRGRKTAGGPRTPSGTAWPRSSACDRCPRPGALPECADRVHRRLSASQRPSRGAQRLSASQRFSRLIAGSDGAGGPVLNAFRHHRGSHSCTHPLARSRTSCSQRLSASQRFSRGAAAVRRSRTPVLNAFRHHRGSHLVEPVDRFPVPLVLNAFRHHRGSHQMMLPGAAYTARCSTPFGITEVLTALGWT